MASNNDPSRKRSGCLWAFIAILICGAAILVFVLLLVLLGQASGGSSLGALTQPAGPAVAESLLREGTGKEKVVVIPVHGVIMGRNGGGMLASEAAISDDLVSMIKQAAKDPDVVALVLDLNTPGGEVTATDEVYHALMEARFGNGRDQPQTLPVIACMRSVAASGGYYLAAAASHIVANRLTWTGSIGVLIPGYDYHVLLNEKLGIFPEYYKSGELKDMLNGGRERTENERVVAQELVNEAFEEFATIVATGRQLPLEKVKAAGIGDARIMTGSQALARGLVDELGYPEDAWNKAALLAGHPEANITQYHLQESLLSILMHARSPQPPSVASLANGLPQGVHAGRLYYLCPFSL
jgi:protease IV